MAEKIGDVTPFGVTADETKMEIEREDSTKDIAENKESDVQSAALQSKMMTCIICPVGCQLEVSVTPDGSIAGVTGNGCPRGKKYAITEIASPRRTLTSTVAASGLTERRVPVRTDRAIPKGSITEAMEKIKHVTLTEAVEVGDVIIADFIEAGINLIATKSVGKKGRG